MRKLLALAVAATALLAGNVAKAAAVDIFVEQTTAGSSDWNVSVATDGTTVGAIALLGNLTMTAFTIAPPGTNIDNTGLTGVVADVLGDGTTSALQIVNSAAGLSFASGPKLLLGVLTITPGSGPNPGNIVNGDDLFGYTVLDAGANIVTDYSLTVTAAPEPASLLLLGTGLAGLALLRRRTA